ncbi:uncharacterized protein LOC143241730 [Tachypleus tridentatus]|uniref:uncharacterized protein LOC143241730 n=1 Tax=Tachypleus tridentatus TaxID=6853 RepID=UPI003FD29D20
MVTPAAREARVNYANMHTGGQLLSTGVRKMDNNCLQDTIQNSLVLDRVYSELERHLLAAECDKSVSYTTYHPYSENKPEIQEVQTRKVSLTPSVAGCNYIYSLETRDAKPNSLLTCTISRDRELSTSVEPPAETTVVLSSSETPCLQPLCQGCTNQRSSGIAEVATGSMRVNGAIRPSKELRKSVSSECSSSSMKTQPHNQTEGENVLVGVNIENSRYTQEKKPTSGFHKPSVGYRLGRRKALFERRKRISDYSLGMAMFGVGMMVVETELSGAGVYTKASVYSTAVKTLTSVSTVILLGLIIAYHALEVQKHVLRNDSIDLDESCCTFGL